MRYSYIVPQFFSYHCTQRTIEIIYFLTFCGEKIYLLNHYTLKTNMKNIRYETKKDFLYIKGKTNKNWADPHTFFEKFAIKHFFYENWGDLNTFFLTIVERGFKVAYLLSSRNTTKSNREILILLDYSTMLHRTIIHKVGGIQRSSVICFQCFKL